MRLDKLTLTSCHRRLVSCGVLPRDGVRVCYCQSTRNQDREYTCVAACKNIWDILPQTPTRPILVLSFIVLRSIAKPIALGSL